MSAEVHTEGGMFTAVTRDLSEGGVGIELSQLLPDGELVTLGLFLVVDDVEEERVPPLWVKGRVVWSGELDSGGAVAGVRFEVITAQQTKWLRHLLGHLTPVPRPR
jgi:PilZ domain